MSADRGEDGGDDDRQYGLRDAGDPRGAVPRVDATQTGGGGALGGERVAYRSWCDERRVPALVEEYASLPDCFTAEQDAVGRLLHHEPRPDAVIGVYSDSGHNILAAARRQGLRVPGDLLVACISEDPDYATTTPPVTTVSLRPDSVGAEAVDLLIAVINGRSGVDRRRLAQPVLLPRRSTRRAVPRRNGEP
ncbi:substrate-binding domain-containing protein [Streptomyces sp. NPDC051243]|uniref:substrate-binding domain-containing protein n=1 Tax=Streptomyces sp. NPDC051243 TaxID=3365646 RepID=UPI0037907979